MKLIDADALIAQLKAVRIRSEDLTIDYKRGHSDGIITAVDYADDAPTINPESLRPHGRWEITDAYPHWMCCSVCHKAVVRNIEVVERYEIPTSFCPNCGAKMEDKP